MRILGIDPGIRNTGWGIVSLTRGTLTHVANGVIQPDPAAPDAVRLNVIAGGLAEIIAAHQPQSAAIEAIFVAKSAASALKLGMARGVAMMACGTAGLDVAELAAREVKKAVVGTGGADKAQMGAMVTRLLGVKAANADAADALAIAIAAAHGAMPAGLGSAKKASSGGGLEAAIEAALARDNAAATGKAGAGKSGTGKAGT